MKQTSKTSWLYLVSVVTIVLWLPFSCSTTNENSGFEISIVVAPNVLNLQNRGQVVTVHSDIAYSWVDASSVYLNGTEIESWKADDNGNFVAKFYIDSIKNLPLNINEYNTLKMVGKTTDNQSFWGEDDIKVINTES